MVKLEVKASAIQGAGKGLFMGEDVKKGDILGEYEGRRFCPWKVLSGMREMYAFSTPADVLISPADDCLFRYANDIVNLEKSLLNNRIIKHPNLSYNIDWRVDKETTREAKRLLTTHGKRFYFNRKFLYMERVEILATQDIKAGSELFINYGNEYWKPRITNPEHYA